MLNIVLKPHRTHLKAQTGEPQKLFVMLRLIPEKQIANARPPLALALVIDTSGSMRDEVDNTIKLERAIEAAHKLIDDPSLASGDKLTIIQFDDESKVLLPLSHLARSQAHQVVDSLRQYSGGTEMGKGMQNALQELSKEPPEVAKRLILLTDGQTFDEERCRSLGAKLAETNTPIISIGIGEEYNEDLLRELADVTKGRWLHLQNMQQLDQFFGEEIHQVVREVVTDLQLKIAVVKGVTLDSIIRVYPNLVDIPLTSQSYRLGNISAGDYTVFILEFTVSGIPRPPGRARLVQFNLWASVPGLKQRQIEFSPKELFVTLAHDETAIAQVDPEVPDYVAQKNCDQLVAQATKLAAQGKNGRGKKDSSKGARNDPVAEQSQRYPFASRALEKLNRTGTISAETRRTLCVGGRTMMAKPGKTAPSEGGLSEEGIRRITGT